MSTSTNSKFARGSLGRCVLIAIGLLIVLVVASPSIVAKSPLRNMLLRQIGAQDDLLITAESAEFGWLTPLALRGLSIERDQPGLSIQVERVELERS